MELGADGLNLDRCSGGNRDTTFSGRHETRLAGRSTGHFGGIDRLLRGDAPSEPRRPKDFSRDLGPQASRPLRTGTLGWGYFGKAGNRENRRLQPFSWPIR
jgi:hypothetical protein